LGEEPSSHRDSVTLGDNRRTLEIDWHASAAIDQVRVIVLDEKF
jgi:hypothetical protein